MVSLSGLLNKAFAPRSADYRSSQTPPEIITRVTGGFTSSGSAVISVMDAAEAVRWYERVSLVFRCIDLIATTQCSIPIVVRSNYGEGEIQDDPHLFRLLNVSPNEHETGDIFRYRISSILLLDPRGCLIEIQRSKAGIPISLHIIPPGTWQPYREARADGQFHSFVDSFRVTNSSGMTEIMPKDAIWIRHKPHPVDPYQQMTPLMAARLSIETDFFARLFNRNFLVNDGRPGLLVAVKGDISEEDAEELRRRFSGGFTRAGQTTVIQSDGMDIQDLASSPRDIQWDAAVKGSDQDIMLAFGTPESVLGNASGRTFNNADAEWSNFWELTMKSHNLAISKSMDKLSGSTTDTYVLIHDYDKVPVLQIPKREAEQRSEERWKAGVITLNEHLAEIGRETIDEDYANVHFLHNNIIAADQETADRVAKLPVIGVPAMPDIAAMGGVDPNAVDQGSGFSVTQLSSGYEDSPVIDAEFEEVKRIAAPSSKQIAIRAKSLELAMKPEEKSPYNRDRMDGILEGILSYWSNRQAEIVISRLDHSKFREGTRFWEGEQKVLKQIDPSYPVQPEVWAADLTNSLMQKVDEWMADEAKRTIREMQRRGVSKRIREMNLTPVREALSPVYVQTMNQQVRDAVAQNVMMAANSKMHRLELLISELDNAGASLADIKDRVRDATSGRSNWERHLASNTVTSAMEGVRHGLYSRMGSFFMKSWNTSLDEKVRETHREVSNRKVPAAGRFVVGGFPMRFPGDPEAPISLTINCRCFLTYDLH